MKRILLGIVALLIGSAMLQAQEAAQLTKIWSHSLQEANFAPIGTESRTMAYANGKLYFADRASGANYIHVYDATTGDFLKKVTLPGTVFSGAGYPNNCIRTDAVGNLVLANMALNIQTNNLQVWKMADEDAEPVKILDSNVGNLGLPSMRIDFLSVYGDVSTNGYIIAPISSTAITTNIVLLWDIVNGVVAEQPLSLQISDFYPVVTTPGAAPFILPISNTEFYFDGASTHPAIYTIDRTDQTATFQDGFKNAPNPSSVSPLSPTGNGVAEVSLSNRRFLITSNNDHGVTGAKNSFNLYEIENGSSFNSITKKETFPASGLGSATNSVRVVVPIIEKINETKANVYLYGYLNGYAKYELTIGTSGIISEEMGLTNPIIYSNGQFYLPETVSSVEVYSIDGHKITSKSNVSELSAPTHNGLYIVKTISKMGILASQKVLVK